MPDGEPPRLPPLWLSVSTLAVFCYDRGTTDIFTRVDTSKAVHDAILAHHPALPFTLIGEAAAFVLGME